MEKEPPRHEDELDGAANLEPEVQLITYLQVLWRYRVFIVSVSATFGLVALVVSSRQMPLYEASATLMMNAGPAGVPNTIAMLENRGLAQEVIEELGMSESPLHLTATEFIDSVLRVEEIPETSFIDVTITLSDPDLATNVANRLATRVVELELELSRGELARIQDALRTLLDRAEQEFSKEEQRLLALRQTSQVELRRHDNTLLLEQRRNLANVLVNIEIEQARVQKREEELSKHQQILTVKRSFETDASPMEAAQQGDGSVETDLLRLSLDHFNGESESLNPLYEVLNRQAANDRVTLAALERERDSLIDELNMDARQFDQISDLYKSETEIDRSELEYRFSRNVYISLTERYEQATNDIVTQASGLQLIDQAVTPEEPISPRPRRSFAIALAAGLLLSIVAAFVLNNLLFAFRL